ncbi:hypothetical protein ABL78_3088 [Leptomonas seymouri]|uniref:Uncharacterized protein n=1 Tax=Leptomonas seymouri TaxID=5684 RepID=A0A0N1I022_LEPSE|nr:hypothetical protein ABL78_3088 [Leptomonas seymouri]|eukprot:KPI87861.1 hypothetical protein ABL78_3088 [Leptomonas seymouri]
MRCALLTALLVSVVLSTIPGAHAYTTTARAYTSSTGIMAFSMNQNSADQCTAVVPGSHIAMPTSPSIQATIVETANRAGITSDIPIGGGTMHATCTNEWCTWRWYRGFFFFIWPVFYRGVHYTGPDSSQIANPRPRVQAVEGSYTNWEARFPVSWSNLSYWGKRLVVLQPNTGKWRNVEISTQFRHLVCEHYVYTHSDGVNGVVPTFPDGSPITIVNDPSHVYSFCGRSVGNDSLGRWILPNCERGLPWWAGLVIAAVCYTLLIAIIITVWCCCCAKRREKEERERHKVISSELDNVNNIPNQSELGLYSNRSFMQSHESEDDTYSDRGATELGNGGYSRE